jgi:hypothetical protein
MSTTSDTCLSRIQAVTDLVQEAVGVMWPVLAAGGVATAQGMAEEGGARLLGATGAVVARIRHRLGAEEGSRPELEAALRDGLAAGEIQEKDLEDLLTLGRSKAGVFVGSITAERVNFGSITVTGGNVYL